MCYISILAKYGHACKILIGYARFQFVCKISLKGTHKVEVVIKITTKTEERGKRFEDLRREKHFL